MGTYSLSFNSGLYTKSGNTYDLGTLPGWAYSRSTDANLTTTYAPQSPNLLLYSSDLTNAAWTYAQAGYTAGQTAPDGSATAYSVADTVVTNTHTVTQTVTIPSGATVTGSVYLKQNTGTYCQVLFNNSTAQFYVTVNLATGAITESVAAGGATIASSSIAAAANGYYRVTVTGSCPSVTSLNFLVAGTTAATGTGFAPSYLGAYSRYVWGPQVELGTTANGYLPTTSSAPPALATFPATTTNLLQGSSVLSNTTYWSSFAGTVTSGQSDPAGGANAFQIAQTNGTSSDQVIAQSGSVTQTASTATTHTYSVYLKSGTYDYVRLAVVNQGISQYIVMIYQFSTKSLSGNFNSGGWAVTSTSQVFLSNGWVRISITLSTPSATSIGAWVGPSNNLGSSITGTATNNILVYGPQIVAGAVANPYVPTTTSSTVSAAIPRITNLGLWEEPQSINLDNATTTSSPFVATGTTTTDPAGGSAARIQSQTSNFLWTAAASWTSGNTYTVSFYVKSGGGSPALQYLQVPFSTTNVAGSAYVNFDIINGTVTQSSGISASSITAAPGAPGWFRCVVTVLCGTTNALSSYLWPITNGTQGFHGTAPGVASYYTLWGYQNEQGSTATTYILGNANGNAQRGADVTTLTYSPNDASTTLTYGPTPNTASPSASSPINLGASSGGAWIGSYIQSFVTNTGSGSGAGAVSAAATVSGVGAASAAATGAVSGAATVSGVGVAVKGTTGAVSGAATVSGVGASSGASTGIGAVSGAAMVSGVGASTATATGAISAAATASGVGAASVATTGAVSGVATVSGVGSATIAGVGTGSITGTATVSGVGNATASAIGAVNGQSTVVGVALSKPSPFLFFF
jgi:hypothetical protein